jgi:hypothetical protein
MSGKGLKIIILKSLIYSQSVRTFQNDEGFFGLGNIKKSHVAE